MDNEEIRRREQEACEALQRQIDEHAAAERAAERQREREVQEEVYRQLREMEEERSKREREPRRK